LRLYLAAWIPLAAVYAALFAAAGASPGSALRGAIASVLPLMLLGLVVLRLPHRLGWSDERRPLFFLTHLVLAITYGVIGTAGVSALRLLDGRIRGGAPVRLDPLMLAWQSVVGALIYLVIAGVAHAWQNARRVREEAERAARADALRARAELAALRSQLNPHFLLNTLHAALGLVRRDPPLAERAIERLGEVLHYGLRLHRESLDEVRLADEWAFVRSYLEIESLRLEDRLHVELRPDPDAMDALVPPFVLQPLVENAIVHAVAPRKSGGRVAITARRRGDRLVLEVQDDGPGLAAVSGAGLGLRLLRDRLALLYGGAASLSLEPGPVGLSARIELPIGREIAAEPA
jgi:two-component system, LytTR family, sensor kinase